MQVSDSGALGPLQRPSSAAARVGVDVGIAGSNDANRSRIRVMPRWLGPLCGAAHVLVIREWGRFASRILLSIVSTERGMDIDGGQTAINAELFGYRMA